MICFLIKTGNLNTETHTGRKLGESEGRDQGEPTGAKEPQISDKPPEAERKNREQICPSQPQEEPNSADSLIYS